MRALLFHDCVFLFLFWGEGGPSWRLQLVLARSCKQSRSFSSCWWDRLIRQCLRLRGLNISDAIACCDRLACTSLDRQAHVGRVPKRCDRSFRSTRTHQLGPTATNGSWPKRSQSAQNTQCYHASCCRFACLLVVDADVTQGAQCANTMQTKALSIM